MLSIANEVDPLIFRCIHAYFHKNLLLPHWGLFKYAWAHQGRIFCLLYGGDVLDMLDPLGKSFLLPY